MSNKIEVSKVPLNESDATAISCFRLDAAQRRIGFTDRCRSRAPGPNSKSRTEGVGFEPTVGFPTLDFESSALNRTQPPFLDKNKTSNVQRPTSNDRRKDRENPVCEEASGSPFGE